MKTTTAHYPYLRNITTVDAQIMEQIKDYTICTTERHIALIQGIRHIVRTEIPGCFVECGVWRGGSSMAAALTFMDMGITNRHLWLYDTYRGMTAPTEEDRSNDGKWHPQSFLDSQPPLTRYKGNYKSKPRYASVGDNIWCIANRTDVECNMETTGYPSDHIHYIEGPVETTIPGYMPTEAIAMLRLDADWYSPTKHGLNHLFPRMSKGGIIIVDDYGHWAGSKQAIDEFFESLDLTMYPISIIGFASPTQAIVRSHSPGRLFMIE